MAGVCAAAAAQQSEAVQSARTGRGASRMRASQHGRTGGDEHHAVVGGGCHLGVAVPHVEWVAMPQLARGCALNDNA